MAKPKLQNKHQLRAEQCVAVFNAFFPTCQVRAYDAGEPKGTKPYTIAYDFDKQRITQTVLDGSPEETVKQLYGKVIGHQLKLLAKTYSTSTDPIFHVNPACQIGNYFIASDLDFKNPFLLDFYATEADSKLKYKLFSARVSPDLIISHDDFVKPMLELEAERVVRLELLHRELTKLGYGTTPDIGVLGPWALKTEFRLTGSTPDKPGELPVVISYDVVAKVFKTQLAGWSLNPTQLKWLNEFTSDMLELTPQKLMENIKSKGIEFEHQQPLTSDVELG